MAKHSDLYIPNYSLLNASDSQVFGSSESLSIPSEPPDIRNWFSSYECQSPELNVADDFEGCVDFKESNCGKEGFDIEEEKNLVIGEKEAPDVFVNINSSGGDNNYSSEVLDSADSISALSVLSEPPNIKNWFSSYVYESPTLDTANDFRVSDSEESESEREGFNAGKSGKGIEEGKYRIVRGDELVSGEKIALNGFVKCNNSSFQDNMYENRFVSKGNHGVDENNNFSGLNDFGFERIPKEGLENKMAENHVFGSIKNVKNVSLIAEDSTENLDLKLSQESERRSSSDINNTLGNNERKSPRKLLHRRKLTEKPTSYLDSAVINGDSIQKPTSGSSDKENDEKCYSENGFVSTRKSRKVSDENYLRRPFMDRSKSLRKREAVSGAVEKNATALIKRRVLSETTNFQHSDESEIAGKWKCPQKSKPNLGPPLKQLRLERWVHRV